MATMLCTSCGREVLEEDKCTYCDGAFRTRLCRALRSMKDGTDASVAVDFNKLSEEAKVKFKLEHHDKLGNDLKMAIRQQVQITRRTQVIQSALAKGHMKDEADLTEKYSKKPEQLAAIFKNAHSFTCPVRCCKLWADPDFCTEWNFTMTENTEQLIKLETSDTAKPAKRQKTERAPPIEGPETDEKVFKVRDLKKLKELLGKVKEDVDKYSASVEGLRAGEYEEYIPTRVMAKINEKKDEVIEELTSIGHILESGKSRYAPTELRHMICKLRKPVKEAHIDVKSREARAKIDMAN